MVDMIEDITYRDQSMSMPPNLEARVFLPGTSIASRHRRLVDQLIVLFPTHHNVNINF